MNINEDLYARRLVKFGDLPVNKMSSTTRYYFKKKNHRKEAIIAYEKDRKKKGL